MGRGGRHGSRSQSRAQGWRAMEKGLEAAGRWDCLTRGQLIERQAVWAAAAALQRAGAWAGGRGAGQLARAETSFISPLTAVAAPGHVVGSVELNQLDRESARSPGG